MIKLRESNRCLVNKCEQRENSNKDKKQKARRSSILGRAVRAGKETQSVLPSDVFDLRQRCVAVASIDVALDEMRRAIQGEGVRRRNEKIFLNEDVRPVGTFLFPILQRRKTKFRRARTTFSLSRVRVETLEPIRRGAWTRKQRLQVINRIRLLFVTAKMFVQIDPRALVRVRTENVDDQRRFFAFGIDEDLIKMQFLQTVLFHVVSRVETDRIVLMAKGEVEERQRRFALINDGQSALAEFHTGFVATGVQIR